MRKKSTFLAIMLLFLSFVGIQNVRAQEVSKFVGPAVFNQNGDVGYSSKSSYERLNGTELSTSTSYTTADDFVVPSGETWDITAVYAKGSSYSDVEQLDGFNVTIYSDAGRKPADTLYHYAALQSYFLNDGDVVIYLGETLSLPTGPYWISVQSVSDYSDWSNYSWSWSMLEDVSMGHIMEQPYYKTYKLNNESQAWGPASSYSIYNCAFSLHTSYTNDLAITMVSPTTGPNMTDGEEIGIEIYNIGKTAQSNFEVKYSVNGGNEVVETINETIEPLASMRYAFDALADLSEAGIYNIDVMVALANDESAINDTVHAVIENFGLVYEMDEVADATTTACGGIFADAGGLEGTTDGQSYTTTFKPEGENTRSVLEFNFVELVVNGWFGPQTYGELTVYDGEDTNAPVLGVVNGAIAEGDEPDVFTATNTTGALTVAYNHLNPYGDAAGWTANIFCIEAEANDLAITEIVSPTIGAQGAAEAVTVAVKNFGYNDQTNVAVSYTLNDGTAVNETIDLIAAGETVEHTFANTLDFSEQGKYNLAFEVTLANDAAPDNNTIEQLYVNYGTVYLISADTILNDTLQVCGGVLTDEGGVGGQSGTNFEVGMEMTTTLQPTQGKRMQLVLEEMSLSTGGVFIYDGWNHEDTTPQIAYWTGNTLPDNPVVYATNPDGVLTVYYITPSIPMDDGFVASMSCIDILANEFDVQNLNLSQKLIFEQDEIAVTADVRNIGSAAGATEAYLMINAEAVDTLVLENMAVDSVNPIAFTWIPEVAGEYTVSIALSDDDNNDNNIQGMATNVYIENHLAESFEAPMFPPLYWISAQGRFGNYWDRSAPHGDTVANTYSADTLLTPRLIIEAGDVLTFYAWADEISGFGPTIPAGYLRTGWYDEETMEYHLFDNQEEVTKYWTKYTIDLTEAAGVNRIAFFAEDGALKIDMVEGPEIYFDENDLELVDYKVTNLTSAGIETNFNIEIRNKGSRTLTADDYSIDFYRVGEENPFFVYDGIELSLRDEVNLNIPYIFSQAETSDIYVVLNFDADIDPTNNISNAASINVLDAIVNDFSIEGETQNSSSYYPVAVGAKSGVNQFIIPADSINLLGDIQGIGFYHKATYNFTETETYMKIWLAVTDSTALTNSWIPNEDFDLMYDDTITIPGTAGIFYLPLDSVFAYNGGNLAVMVYTYTESTYSHYFYYSPVDTNLVRYATSWSSAIDMDNMPAGYAYANLPNINLYYNMAGAVSATVVDQDANALEGVNVSFAVNGTELYATTTDVDGRIMLESVAVNKVYDITYSLEGYELLVQEGLEINDLETNLGTVEMSFMDNPFNLNTVVDNEAKTATLTWNDYSSKAFVSYNVYLNDMDTPLATELTEATYTFTELADGKHTAGVISIYDGGISDLVTTDFYVLYAPMNLELYVNETNTLATWDFEGTSDDFYGFEVSFDGAVVDTIMDDQFKFEGYTDGMHTVSVAALYTEGGLSAPVEAAFTILVAPMNLTAEVTDVRTITASWEVNETSAVDSFNVYFNNMLQPVATGVTDTSFVFTDVADGYITIGVSSVYAGVESEISTYGWAFVDVDNAVALKNIKVYPNPATEYLNVEAPVNSVVEIYSITGEKVQTLNTTNSISNVSVQGLESGTYIIKVKNNESLSVERIQIK